MQLGLTFWCVFSVRLTTQIWNSLSRNHSPNSGVTYICQCIVLSHHNYFIWLYVLCYWLGEFLGIAPERGHNEDVYFSSCEKSSTSQIACISFSQNLTILYKKTSRWLIVGLLSPSVSNLSQGESHLYNILFPLIIGCFPQSLFANYVHCLV